MLTTEQPIRPGKGDQEKIMSMSKSYSVKGNNRSDYRISGETIVDAIEADFMRIAKDANIGNAAGYKLVSVKAEYRSGILGGQGGVVLRIEHLGAPLAHRAADPEPKVSDVWIYAAQEDLPAAHVFEIGR